MSEPALKPYAPLNAVKPIAPDVWIVDGGEIGFSYMGLRLPFSTRMTVVRLPDGSLWVHSPVEPSDMLFRQVRDLGEVRFIVAPNTLHYWWVPEWKAEFPDAEVHAAPGLQSSAKRELPVDHELGDAPPPDWDGTIDQVLVPGDLLTEVDFFHRPSRTLVLTDLIENFETDRVRSRLFRLALRWAGAADPDGKAPIDMQLSFVRHRKAVREAVERMIAWEPERIVISHGRWYPSNGTEELKRAFRWVL